MNIDKALEKIKNCRENKSIENYIKEIQKENLSSEEYRKITEFLDSYNNRDYGELEAHIRLIIDNFFEILQRSLFDYPLDELCVATLFRLEEIAKSITYEHESSNDYLAMFAAYMGTGSVIHANNVLREISENNNMGYIQVFNCSQYPDDLFLDIVEEQFDISPYCSFDLGYRYVDKLDKEHMHIYKEYNDAVKSMRQMINAIIRMRVQCLLYYDNCLSGIKLVDVNYPYHSDMISVSFVRQERTLFDNRMYMLNEKTIQNISRVFGMEFDTIATMEPADFEEYTNLFLESLKLQCSRTTLQPEPESSEEHTRAAQLVLTNDHNINN